MHLSKFLKQLNQSQQQLLIIIGFLIAGSLLRVLWPEDMEWKSEEKWMFEQAQLIVRGELPLPLFGMKSSVLVKNPGMSIWCFAAIAKFAHDPIAMVQWIQCLNVATIWLFFGFILWQISQSQQASWLWGIAIMAVNPFAILFSRRIWTPDLLPPFCLLVFVGHWFRNRFWGGFLWGIMGIASGQVQMGGFFLVIGLFIWTVWHDYRHTTLKQTSWLGWFVGTLVGSIPLIPWAVEILPQMESYRSSFVALLVPKFYSQWITAALGINLSYALNEFFWADFLRSPILFGIPTYLMMPAHFFLVGIGIYPLYRWFKSRQISAEKQPLPQAESPLNFYLQAMAFGVGGAFTLSRVNVHPYYIVIAFPFIYFWLANLYRHQIKLLIAIALTQLLISLTFLNFVHSTGGMPGCGGGYGVSYRFQVERNVECYESWGNWFIDK